MKFRADICERCVEEDVERASAMIDIFKELDYYNIIGAVKIVQFPKSKFFNKCPREVAYDALHSKSEFDRFPEGVLPPYCPFAAEQGVCQEKL